jgi:Zn-dependent protease with chaperone function
VFEHAWQSDVASTGVLIIVQRPFAHQPARSRARGRRLGAAPGAPPQRCTTRALTERSDLIFGACLVVAGGAAATLTGAMVEAGSGGIAGFAAVSAGLVSACILFAIELRDLPPALDVAASTALASSVALVHSLRVLWREQRSLRALPVATLAASTFGDSIPYRGDVNIDVLRSHRRGAFCAGLLRPRVVITTALLDALGHDERRAVVEHELSHARNHAPLKLALGRLAARTLFWVPLLHDLVERHVLLTELEADRAAIAATSPTALAGALSQALESPATAGGIGLADHAAARVDRLFDARAKLPRLISPSRAVITLCVVAMAAALLHSSPHPSSSESAQLHTMSVNLLAHHLQARLMGLAATAVTLGLALAAARRFADGPHRARAASFARRARQ